MSNDVRATIWKYYIHNFLRDFAFFSAVLVPFFTDWGNITLFQVQILQSLFMLWIFILEVPTGAVADFLGRKYSLALGAFINVFGALLYGSIPNFTVFLFGEFLFAVGMALTSGANQALLYDALKEAGREEESNNIFGKAHSATLLGILVSAPLGSIVASRFGLNAPMLFTAIPMFLASVIALTIKEPKRFQNVSESRRYIEIMWEGLRFFSTHKKLKILALDAILVASAGYFVIWLYQPLLKMVDVPLIYFGLGHVLLVGTEIIIASNFVRLEKFFGSGKSFLKYSAIFTALPFLVTAIFPSIFTVLLFIAIAGGFGMTRLELMSAYMNRFIPSEQRATVLSSISMFRRFALVIINPIIGFSANYSLIIALLLVSLLPLSVFLFSPVEQETLEKI